MIGASGVCGREQENTSSHRKTAPEYHPRCRHQIVAWYVPQYRIWKDQLDTGWLANLIGGDERIGGHVLGGPRLPKKWLSLALENRSREP